LIWQKVFKLVYNQLRGFSFHNNSSDLTHPNSWLRTTYYRQGSRPTSGKTIVGLCQGRKTAPRTL